jgi:NADPH-dependent curcumin reductase CurA
VVASENPALRPGDAVVGMLGWQEYAVARADDLRKVDPGRAPLSTALGVLGVPGLTAFFALLEVCDPRRGETVVVSGAGDAVGMLAGQIAKIMGCRVVGLVGSDADAAWLEAELGFDAAFAPGSGSELDARLAELCPRGIDVYFDNVGGATTDAVMRRIGAKARIVVCAQSSQDNLEQPESGPRWLMRLLATQGRVQGFGVAAYSERFGEGLHHLGAWLGSGRLRYREDVAQGIAAAPQAFIGLLDGRSQGRQLVQLSEW